MIFTKAYWSAALERAISAGAASVTGGLTLDAIDGFDLDTWKTVGVTFAVGFCFSILKGLTANATNGGLGPGIGAAEVTAPAVAMPDEPGQRRGDADRSQIDVAGEEGTLVACETPANVTRIDGGDL